MKTVIFCHSLTSDWGHDAAHFLRGVIGELQASGHAVDVYEPEEGWSRRCLLADQGQAAGVAFATRFLSAAPRVATAPASLEPRARGLRVAPTSCSSTSGPIRRWSPRSARTARRAVRTGCFFTTATTARSATALGGTRSSSTVTTPPSWATRCSPAPTRAARGVRTPCTSGLPPPTCASLIAATAAPASSPRPSPTSSGWATSTITTRRSSRSSSSTPSGPSTCARRSTACATPRARAWPSSARAPTIAAICPITQCRGPSCARASRSRSPAAARPRVPPSPPSPAASPSSPPRPLTPSSSPATTSSPPAPASAARRLAQIPALLGDAAKARALATQGRATVLARHTCAHRIAALLEILRGLDVREAA